jgi:hypothetical protein
VARRRAVADPGNALEPTSCRTQSDCSAARDGTLRVCTPEWCLERDAAQRDLAWEQDDAKQARVFMLYAELGKQLCEISVADDEYPRLRERMVDAWKEMTTETRALTAYMTIAALRRKELTTVTSGLYGVDKTTAIAKRVYLDIPGEFLTEAAPQPELPAVGDVVVHEGRSLFVVQRRFESERVVLRVHEANERDDLASTWGPLATAHERKLIWSIHQALCFKVGPALDEVIAPSVDAFAPTSAPDTLRTTETRISYVDGDDVQDEPPAEDAPRERLRGEHFDIFSDDVLLSPGIAPDVHRQRFWHWLTIEAVACFDAIQIVLATRFVSQASSLGYPPPQVEKTLSGTMWLTWNMKSIDGLLMINVHPDGVCWWSVRRHDGGEKIVLSEGPADETDPVRGSSAEHDVRERYKNAKDRGDAAQVEALRWRYATVAFPD